MLSAIARTGIFFIYLGVAYNAAAQSPVEVSPASRIALGIETETVKDAGALSVVTATGLVTAPAGATQSVYAPMNGVVIETYVIAGQNLKKGEKVAVLYSETYAETRTALKKAELAAEHDDHLAERAEELRELGLRSDAETDEAQHEAKTSRLTVQALRSRLAQAKVAPGAGRYYVTAKQSGIVTHLTATAGQSLTEYQPIARLFVGGDYWARIQVADSKINQLSLGMSVSLSDGTLDGTVIAIDPEVDPASRSVEVMVALPNTRPWRLGEIVTVDFQSKDTSGAIPIPTRAIVRMGGQSFVFAETETGFSPVPVNVKTQSGAMSLVTGALSMGDEFAVSGLAALKNASEGG